MASGAQQLIEAIQLLYAHPNDKVKRQAGEWLEQWQQSVEAWSMSDAVLHDRSCAVEAHYFCAQTLRTKVSLRTMNLTEAVSTLCPSSLHKVPSECSLRGLFLRCKAITFPDHPACQQLQSLQLGFLCIRRQISECNQQSRNPRTVRDSDVP